jgi:C4-dicarboxylate-specific signal transduction histidine kinase
VLNGSFDQQSERDAEYRLLTKSGSYRWFSARALMIRQPDGRPCLVSGSIQDIHARKQAEETIRRQGEYLIQKQKMEALGELAGEVAHEFNNALQAINGQIQFAYNCAPDQSTTKKDLDTATLLIKEAAQFTRQLLDFGRPNCFELRPISVNGVLQRLGNVLRPLLGGAIDLQFRCNEKSGYILADPVSLQQALMNLCINARDAMRNGGTHSGSDFAGDPMGRRTTRK